MNQVTCKDCSRSIAPAEAYEVNGKVSCGPCAESEALRAKAAGQAVKVMRYVDKSICARCSTYIGDGGGVPAGNVRLCLPCSQLVENWPYPQWLKLSLAGLLLVLVFALAHGRKYFQAGLSLYRGEQLVEQGKYEKALAYLKETLKVAPNSDKGALLAAKAAILSGDMESAGQALQGHNSGHFENGDAPDFREVDRLWNNANQAMTKLEQAEKLEEQDGNEVAAAKLARDAAKLYPQMSQLDVILDHFDSGVAFASKDYDTYVNLAEKDWKSVPVSPTAATFASALACKYAVTGDLTYRERSEDMVAKAKELAKGDAETLKRLAEFEERNQYRLDTRQILTKMQYDQKFRNVKTTAK